MFQNIFQPSLKLKNKIRIGSKLIQKYEPAKTPFQRILESGIYHRTKVKKLKGFRDSLDPFVLSKTIDQKLDQIFKMASERLRTKKQAESLQQRALESSRTNEKGSSYGQLSPDQRAYRDNIQFTREARWLKKTMVHLKRQASRAL